MAEVEKIDKWVKDYLMNVGYERWSIAHSIVNRTLIMTSNIVKSINAALKVARELPVLPLLEYIRQLIGRWNVTNKKNKIESFTDLGKRYDTMLMDNLELSHRMKCPHVQKQRFSIYCSIYVYPTVEILVTPLASYLYSVLDKGKQRMVFLKDRTCSCRRFHLGELSCAHARAILKYKYIDHTEYCSVYYPRKYLLKTYEILIYLVPDKSTWKIPAEVLDEKVLPPYVTKRIGRPRKGMCKPISEREQKMSISCG
ncbi:uncharacterized protein [Nicotiana sylvestris]|uniref:Uncharacterized protein LOC104219035 n=1 Tax=Nicotiana sylvestris TaxID=4096 RepID=A0A1U7VNK3_NICSY|nr:PREDICTED: uncharacterized protein LOC104219035 [Nicotiana sylvestris]